MGRVENPTAGGGDPLAARGDTVLQSEILESLASAVNYNNWLTSLAAPHLGEWPIELGSGLGDYAQTWLNAGVPRITTTEIDASRLARLRSRFAGDQRVEVESFDILAPPLRDHSALVAFNVLEHITDHVRALQGAHQLLRPGGLVIVFVPAFPFAMSRFDLEVGHVRRYTVAGMCSALSGAGLDVIEARYVNMPGLPAWFVTMRLLRMAPSDGALLAWWDKHVIPRARSWEYRHRVPFGQSVLAIGRVPAAAEGPRRADPSGSCAAGYDGGREAIDPDAGLQ
jgi:SAM-dependent methyltransferase